MKLKLKILVLAYLLLICGTESTILNQTDDLVVLTKVGSPYKIHQNLVVDENQTLIIEPGVTLLFAPTKQFTVKGNLIAEGTNDERITLASLENHSTTNHLTNYSISRNLRFLNESGYPSGKLELFDSNKWHKVCFRRNEDKINQDYFVKSICSNFGYRKGWIKKSFNSAGFRIALISSCSENHIQSFDFRDYCYLRTDLNGSFTWYYQECFEIECMNESSFVHHWGGLVIDGISKSEKTNLSFVDINEAGDWSNGLDGFALDLRGNNDFSIKNINIKSPTSNGLIARQSNFIVENFNFTEVPLSAIYLSTPSEHNGESFADFRIKNSIFVNNTIGINVIDWIGNLSIQSIKFYLNEKAIMNNDKTNLEWKIRVKNCTFFRNKADFSLKMNPKRNNVSSVLLFENNYFLETEKESINVYLHSSLLINLIGNNFEKINSKIFNLDLEKTNCHRYYCTLLLNLNVSKNSFVSNNVNDVLYLNLNSVLDKSSSIVIENNDFINNWPREKNNNPSILFKQVSSVINFKILFSQTVHQIGRKIQIKKNNFLNSKSIYEIAFEYIYDYYEYHMVANMIIDLSENFWNRTVDEIWLSIFDFHVDYKQPFIILNSLYTNSERNILKKIDNLNDFANVNSKGNQIYSQIHGNVTLVSGVYYARQNVFVKKDSILNIGPNVTILFSSSTELIVEGKLNISGSLYQPVQFRTITKFDDLNKEKRLRLNDLKYLTEGSKITFSGRIESKIENKWYSLCADHPLKETYFEKMCQWMGFEMYVGYTVAKFNVSFIHNMTCSYNSLDSCSFEICHVNCECINHVMLTCKSYSTHFKGIHLTQYAKRSKINNLKLAGYGNDFWYSFETAIQIDYRNHELENIIIETTDTDTIGVWFMDCSNEAISIFNITVLNSFISLRIDNFRSNFTADGLFGNDVNISPNQLNHYIIQYQNPLYVYGQICARLITLGKSDLVQIISSILITSDCFFRIRAEDKSSFLMITDQTYRWSFEQINELNQTINVSTLQGNKKIFFFTSKSNEILIRLHIKKPTYSTKFIWCKFRLELVEFDTIAESDRKVLFKNSKISSWRSNSWQNFDFDFNNTEIIGHVNIRGYSSRLIISNSIVIGSIDLSGDFLSVDIINSRFLGQPTLTAFYLSLQTNKALISVESCKFVNYSRAINYRLQPYLCVDFCQFFIKIRNNTFENILDALNIVEGRIPSWSQSIVKDSLITIESNKFHNCLRALYCRQFNNEKNKFSLKISNNIFENSLDAIRVSVQFDGQRPFMVLGSVISIESNSFHNCSRCIRNENNLRKAKINWHINDNKINNLYSNTTNSQLVSIQGNGTFKNNVITNVTMSNQTSSLFSFKCSDTFLFINNIYTSIATQTKFLIEITCEYGSILQISSNQFLENQINYLPNHCSLDEKPNAIFKLETFLNNLNIFNNTFKSKNNSIEIAAFITTDEFQLDDMSVYETNQLITDFSSNNWNLDYNNNSKLQFNFYSKKFDFKLSHDNSSREVEQSQFSYIIRDDTLWTRNSSPYFLSENVIVLPFASLKIEAGVKINYLKNVTFYIFGNVVIIGTVNSPIYIKSILPPNCLQNDRFIQHYGSNLFYFLSQNNFSMLSNLIIEDSLIKTNLDNKKISTLFVEDGYFPLIDNLTINGCAYSGITILKSLNNIYLKNVKISSCKGNATNLLNLNRDVFIDNMIIEESQNRNLISIDNSFFNQYEKHSFSEQTLACNQDIFLNETFKEYVFVEIIPWLELDCSIKFKTNHDQVIHLKIYEFSGASDFRIKDKDSVEIEPVIGYYHSFSYFPMASNLYASKNSELSIEISCNKMENELCIKSGFFFKLNVLPKIFGLQAKDKLPLFFNFDEKLNTTDWIFDYESNLLLFNYTQSMGYGDNYSQIIESQILKKNAFLAILIKFKSLSYDFYSKTEMLFFLIDNLNETSFLIDRQYMPFRLDNSKSHTLMIKLEKLSYVPDEFRLQIKFIQINYRNEGKYDKTVFFVLDSLLFLPMPQQFSNTKIEIKNSILKDIDINVNTDEYLAHFIDIEIEQSSFRFAKIRAPHSTIKNFYIKNSYFISQALSFEMELERNLLKNESPTNVIFEKCFFLSSSFNKFYIKGYSRRLMNFILVSSEFYENNLKRIVIENGNYDINSNIFKKNSGHFKFQNSDGKLWYNLFKANNNKRYNCDFFIQSFTLYRRHHVFNNSFVQNECRQILNLRNFYRLQLDYNWWDTTNKTLITQMNANTYNSDFKNIQKKDPLLFQSELCAEGWLEWNNKCIKQINSRVSFMVGKGICDKLDSNVVKYLEIEDFLLNYTENINQSFWSNLAYFNRWRVIERCTHLTYSHENNRYELKNSSCEERKSVICDKPLCLNKKNCSNLGKCVDEDKCDCYRYSSGEACDEFYCYSNCFGNGKCIGPNNCTCDQYWSGSACSVPLCPLVDSCTHRNRGRCIAPNKCQCFSGYTGPKCENFTCQYGCRNNGECIGPNTCKCSSGWKGSQCTFPVCKFNCNNRGSCMRPDECRCYDNFNGKYCQDIDCNRMFNCSNNGYCIESNNQIKCECDNSWTGQFCNQTIQNCDQFNNCNSKGKCVFGKCECDNGWTSQNCLQFTCTTGCRNGARCIGPNKCLCEKNWTGTDCNIPLCNDQTCPHTLDFIDDTWSHKSCVAVGLHSTFTTSLIVQSLDNQSYPSQILIEMPYGMTKSPLQKLDQKWMVILEWRPFSWQSGIEKLCFSAIDNKKIPTPQSCISILLDVEDVIFLNSSASPKNEINPRRKIEWTIRTNRLIFGPKYASFIRFFDSNGTQVLKVNTLKNQAVTIGEKELSFVTYFDWKEKESYHVEFDRGAVTASEHCQPESKPVRDKNFWSFKIKDVTPPVIKFLNSSSISRGQLYLEWIFDEPVTTVCTIYNYNINLKNVLNCSHNSLFLNTNNHLLNEGYYSLFIQATDLSGNILNAQHNWQVDLTPPQFYLRNWIKMNNQIGFNCYDRYNRFDRNCHFKCTLIYNSLIYIENNTACSSPFSVGHLQDGYYKFLVEPRDTAGNFGQIKSLKFLLDKNPPDIQLESEQITLESCTDGLGDHRPNVTDNHDANVELSFEHVYYNNCTTTIKWIARDSSGNVAEKNQTIEFNQRPRLNLIFFKSFINVPCDKAGKQSYFNSYLNNHFRFDNECNRPLKFEYIDSIDQIKCDIEFNRTWRIEDDCENVIKRQQIIKILEQKSPDSPPDGQLNSRRNSILAWPEYPNSNNFILNIWWIDENSKKEIKFLNDFEISSRRYSTKAWYPANTRIFWKIDYVIDSLNQSTGKELIPSPIWSFVTKSQPDLYVKEIFVPKTAFSGQFFEVKWFVQNKGNVTTNTWWYDRVFKSRSLDFSRASLIKNIYQRRYVEPRNLDGYTSSHNIELGDDELGNIYIFIQVDAFGYVDDFNRANNLQMSGAIQILQTPSPNLIVQDVFFLNSSFSGQIIEIRFKVKNVGFGVTKYAKWFDCVDLKKANSSQRAINMAIFEHDGKLSSGSSYQSIKKIQIPEKLYGIYEIVVTCDCRKNIYEGSDESDNFVSKYIELIMKPPADLSIDLNIIDQKEEYFTGDFVQVEMKIENVGLGITLENNWFDSLTLKDSLNKEHQKKSWYHAGQLDVGSFYSYQHRFQLAPLLKNGIYHLEAKADSSMRVFEFLPKSKANNIKRVKFNLTRSLPDFVISFFSFEVKQTDTGSYLNVNYSITNNGQENILQNNFGYFDSFYFEKRNSSYLIKRYGQRVNINRNLGAWKENETREYSQTILLDDQIYGDQIYICLNFDYWRKILQSNYSNNFGRYLIANSLIKYQNSLKLLNFTVAQKESFYFNQIVSLEWHAINNGNKRLSVHSIDYVYVALDQIFALKFNPRYRVAAKIKNEIDLKLNETYSKKIDIKIPSVDFFKQNRQAYFVIDIAKNIFPSIVISNTTDRTLFKMFKVQPEPKAKFVAQELNFTLNEPKTAVYVTFKVKNVGNSMLRLSKWNDQILLEDLNKKIYLKESIQVEDRVRSGDEYVVKRAIPMPKLENGIYNLFLIVDADKELTVDSKRFYGPEKIVVNVKKDNPINKISINLINVTNGNSLDKLISGSLVEVYYKVETEHLEKDFKLNVWLNEIYILNFQTNNTEKIKFGKILSRIELIQQIKKNRTYFLKQSFEMPFYLNDNFFFYILMFQQDQKNTIVQTSSKNSYQIVDGLRPDLVVSLVKTTDQQVVSGSELEIFFQISNKNGGILSAIKNWNDDVYLSEDSILDLYDVKLLSKNNLPTQTNNSDNQVLYSRHVKVSIPFDLNSQYYYIIVQTDSSKSVIEHDEDNNLNSSLIYIQERPSSDLAIAFLNHTQKFEKENSAQLELRYSLQNNGGKEVKSLIHCDSFYLSEDSVWDIYDYQLNAPNCTEKQYLKPFLNISQNLLQLNSTQNVPLMKNGSFYCILKTRSNLREKNLENNVRASDQKVQIFVPQIYLDQRITLNGSQEKLFMIKNVPSDQTLIIKLEISSNLKENSNLPFHRLLIAYENLPSFAIYDAKSGPEQSAEQILILSNTKKGTYYVKVVSFSSEESPGDFKIEILAKLAKFELTDSRPKNILPNGVSTINIIGSNIPKSFTVCLSSNETFLSICSNRTKWISSTNVYVLIDFDQSQYFATDFFDIVMYDRTNLSRSAQITQGIQLKTDLLPGSLKYRAKSQNGIPWREIGQTIIETANIGYNDVHAPLLLMQCEKNRANFKLNIPRSIWRNSFAFIGLSLSDMKSTYSAKARSQMSFLVRQDNPFAASANFKIMPYNKSPFKNQNLVRNFFKKKKYSPALLNQTNTIDQITNNLLNFTNSLSTYENFEKRLSKLVNNLHIEQNVLSLEILIGWTINMAQAEFINQLENFFFDDLDKIAYSTNPNVRLTRFLQMSMVKRRLLNNQQFGVGWQMHLLSIKLRNVSDTSVQMEYNLNLFKCKLKQSLCWLDQNRYFVANNQGPYFFHDIPNSLLYTFNNLSLNMEQIIDLNTNETTAHIEYHLERIQFIIFNETNRKIQLNYSKTCEEQIESITLINTINSQVINKASYLYSQNCRHLLSVQSKHNRIDYSYDWQTDDLVSIDFGRKNVSIEFEFDSNSGHLHAKKTFHKTNKKILLNLVKYNLKDSGELMVTNANSLNDSSDTTIKFDMDGSITYIENNWNQFKSQRSEQFTNSKSTDIEKFYYNDKMVMETKNSINELSITTETQATTRIQFNPTSLFSLKKFTDANNNEYEFVHTSDLGRKKIQFMYPDRGHETFEFDVKSRMINFVRRDRKTKIRYDYNSFDSVSGIEISSENENFKRKYFYEQDLNFEQLKSIVSDREGNAAREILFFYESDFSENPSKIVYPNGIELNYEYNSMDQRTKFYTNQGYSISYHYNQKFELASIVDNVANEEIVRFEYDSNKRLIKQIYSNGIFSVYTWNEDNKIKSVTHYYKNSSISNKIEVFYKNYNRHRVISKLSGECNFRYDAGDQITAHECNGKKVDIEYDRLGNRKYLNIENETSFNYLINNLNQYLSVQSTKDRERSIEMKYDQNGNLIWYQNERASQDRIEYNYANKPIRVVTLNVTCNYSYDDMDNLESKQCSDGSRVEYVVDPYAHYGPNVIGETQYFKDGTNRSIKYYHALWNGLISMQYKDNLNPGQVRNKKYFFQFDENWSTNLVSDENSHIISEYTYDPFGSILKSSSQINLNNNFLYQSFYGIMRLNELNDVYYFRNRLYKSEIGRFLSFDPYSILSSTNNLYDYCNNNPFIYIDTFGQKSELRERVELEAAKAAGGVVGKKVGEIVGQKLGRILGMLLGMPFGLKGVLIGNVAGAKLGKFIGGRVGKEVGKYWAEYLYNRARKLDEIKNENEVENVVEDEMDNVLEDEMENVLEDELKNVEEEDGIEWREEWPRAFDPNDIIGPEGFGPLKRISPSDTLSYKIRFENLINSTAPAQYVFIKLQVNKNLDFRTFELDEFSFSNKEYSIEPGNSYYQQKIDIDAFNTTSKLKDFQMVIRVQAGLDILSKSAFWKLEALDKNTGAPPTDKTIGFLPPNDNSTHIGEGYVKFKIQPSKTAPNMARIDANASIIFDINDPIITPNIFNTIDADAPEIQVEIDPNSENFGTSKLIHLDVGDEADFDKLYVYEHREIFDDLNNQTISESIKLIEQSKGKSIALELDQSLNSINSRSSQFSEKVKLKIYSTDQIGNVRKLKEIPLQLNNPVCDQSNCLNGFCSSTANCVCDLHFIGTDCAQRQNLSTLEPPIVEFFLVNQSDIDQSMNLFVNCIGIDDNANLTLLLYLSSNSSLKEKSLIIEQVELDGRKYFSLNIDLLYSEMNKNMFTVLSDFENNKTMLELICSQSSSGVVANQSIELEVVHSNKLRPHLQIDSNLTCFPADSDIIRIHYSILNQEPESNFTIYIENLNTEFKWKVDYLNNIILIEKDQDSFEGKIDLDIKMVATNNGNIFAQVDRKMYVSFCETESSNPIIRIFYLILKYLIYFFKFFF